MLDEYHCPRNVREMENTIERALVLVRDGIVTEAEIQLRAPSDRIGELGTDPVPVVELALRQAQGLLGINSTLHISLTIVNIVPCLVDP